MKTEVEIAENVPIEQDPRPIVALPRPGIPGILIAAIAIAAAILLFLILDAQRRSIQAGAEADRSPDAAFAPPPPLIVPQEGAVEPQLAPRVISPPRFVPPVIALPPQQQPPPPPPPMPPPIRQDTRPLPPPRPVAAPPLFRQPSLSEPALVIDAGGSGMAAGTLIPAVLETPIDTSRPGMARAIVYRDTFGSNGQRLLVPRGSRLIGEYQSDVRAGQNRVLVNWTRLIRPDNSVVRLGAPAADEMGGAGIPGKVNSFFLTRFLNAALQTALTVGGNLVGGTAANTVIVGLPNSGAGAVAGQGLFGSDDRRPKITVKQGTLFNVFVARDVDFSPMPPADPPAGSTPSATAQ